jgi:putative transport protein
MKALLLDSPLLLLFCIAGLGSLLGQLRVGSIRLGAAAVLFVGLAFGALDPRMELPHLVDQLGLVLFVYTIGLSSGASFFSSFKQNGLRDNLLVVGVLGLAFGCTRAARALFSLPGPAAAGLFAGSLTNTPALAAVVETLARSGASDAERALPVIAYSLTYPWGVLGMIGALAFFRHRTAAAASGKRALLESSGMLPAPLISRSVLIERPAAVHVPVHTLVQAQGLHVVFGRVLRGEKLDVVVGDTTFERGDVVSVIGSAAQVEAALLSLGSPADMALDLDRHALDFRRVFVSNRELFGKRLGDLHLSHRFGALVTRVRRGDVDLIGDPTLALEAGDRVRVVAPRERLSHVCRYFGDSLRAISEVDILTVSLGMGLGVLVGFVPLPLPGGGRFALGSAAGPLLVGLVLGKLGRIGPLHWQLPFSANLTLRQLGMVLFLASVGSRAGYELRSTLSTGGVWPILLSGAFTTLLAAALLLGIGHRVLRIPAAQLAGMLAGLQTQPAVLAYASEQTRDDLPERGYAMVFPVAMVIKIILAQASL